MQWLGWSFVNKGKQGMKIIAISRIWEALIGCSTSVLNKTFHVIYYTPSICVAQTPNLVTLWASISSVLFVQFN